MHGANVEHIGVDAARHDGDSLARHAEALNDRRCRIARRRDDPVAARKIADLLGKLPGGRRHIGQGGDQPDRHRLRPRATRCRAADALRVDDVDALGPDEVLEQAVVAAERERIDGVGCKRNPFAAMGLEIGNERPFAAGHESAGAGLQQHLGDVEGGAGVGLLAQRRHDLQDGGAGKRWRGRARLVESVAHCRAMEPGAPGPAYPRVVLISFLHSLAACGETSPER